MISFLTALPILALVGQSPRDVDQLRALARDGPDSVLVERARRRPDDAREALRQLLATAGGGRDTTRNTALTAAERLAGAFAVAWRDSFYVRRVTRFRSLSPTDRQATVAADSVRRAGDEAKRSAGIDAAIRTWRQSLRRFEVLGDSAGVVAALEDIGTGFFYAQEYDSAEVYLARSLDLAERIGDYRVAANAMGRLGDLSDNRGDLRRAGELYARAGELRERTGDDRGRVNDQNSLAILAATRGDLAGARRAFQAALAAMQGAGDAEGAGRILLNLAHVASIEGDYAEAAAYLREALSTYRARGNRLYTASTLMELGDLAVARGDYPGAVTALSEAAGILRRIGPGPEMNEIDVRVLLAHARANTGDLEGARTELERAEALVSHLSGGGASRAGLALERGNLAVRFNRLAEAEQQYARAERLTTNDEVRQAARYGLAVVLLRRESPHRAEVVLEQLFLRPYLSRHNAARIRSLLGEAASRRGDTATARRALVRALDTLHALSAVADEAETLGKLGDLEAQAGRALVAESFYQRGLVRLGGRLARGIRWQLHAGLAGAARRRGALSDAVGELHAAIAEIELSSGGLPLEEHRAAFRADKWDVYVELALVERARGRTEAAFEASEWLRERQMLDLLARGRIGGARRCAGWRAASRTSARGWRT